MKPNKILSFAAFLVLLTAGIAKAQSAKPPNIYDNAFVALTRIGLKDKIELGKVTANGNEVLGQFLNKGDRDFVFNSLKESKHFRESDGLMLHLFHRGATKSFRQLNYPSLHIVWYADRIQIHFDMHCPGYRHPISSYRHFREVVVNWMHHSTTSQRRVALGLQGDLK